jgi:hypothetical protein
VTQRPVLQIDFAQVRGGAVYFQRTLQSLVGLDPEIQIVLAWQRFDGSAKAIVLGEYLRNERLHCHARLLNGG